MKKEIKIQLTPKNVVFLENAKRFERNKGKNNSDLINEILTALQDFTKAIDDFTAEADKMIDDLVGEEFGTEEAEKN